MLLERAMLCVGAILLIGAARAAADEPMALTGGELDSITVLRIVPDPLTRLRITVENATDELDSLPDEMVTEEIEEERLLLASDPPPSAPAGNQSMAAAATAASGGNEPGSWTEGAQAYTGARAASGTSTWTRNSTARNRVETGSAGAAANDVSRSRTTGWSSSQAVVPGKAQRRLSSDRPRAAVMSSAASRSRLGLAQVRSAANRILRRLTHRTVAGTPVRGF
jgi:hypothetical protein